jgi:hypothetical protein
VISQLEACLRPGPQAAADAMTPNVAFDPANANLSHFLSNVWRDGGTSNTGGSASGQVSAAMVAMPIAPAQATEVTDNIKSGETDPEKLPKLRVSPAIAAPIVEISSGPTSAKGRSPAGRLYVAIVCGGIILLALAAGVALFVMRG